MLFKSIIPLVEITIGLLARVAWTGLIGYGVFVLAKWGLIELAEVIL